MTDTAPAIRDTLKALGQVQKPGHGVPAYTRYINRRLARVPVAIGARIGMSPNQMTALSGLCSLAGLVSVALAPAAIPAGIGAALAFLVGYALDSADGQLARITGRGCLAGEWIDHVVDAVRGPAVHAAVLIGLAQTDLDWRWLLVPIAFQLISTGQFFSQILAEQLIAQRTLRQELAGLKPAKADARLDAEHSVLRSLVTLPLDTGVLCLIFLVWGWPAIFIGVYTALLALSLPIIVVSVYRKYRSLQPESST